MKRLILSVALGFLSNAQASPGRMLYASPNSNQAIMSFDGRVEIRTGRTPTLKNAEKQIQKQVEHLFGPMGLAAIPAVPKGDHQITKISISQKDSLTALITYHYEGTIVLRKAAGFQYLIYLPVNPSTIYKLAQVGSANPCTDDHYQSQGDFWYFWSPFRAGCALKPERDYLVIKAKIRRIENTKKTYPEYARLADQDGVIRMSLMMGMDDPTKGKDPNRSTDVNADNFRLVKKALLKNGYVSRKWSRTEIFSIVRASPRGLQLPYVEEFTKDVQRNQESYRLQIILSFMPTGIDEKSTAFHFLYKDALENSAVAIYDGHSGLGGNLDLSAIEDSHQFRIQPNPHKYQIYFFNSCSSYTYYNTMYFDRKMTEQDPRGTKNLDIFTNGLATYFYVMHDTNLALISAIEDWASGGEIQSYQQLAEQIDSENLFGINGDEDNPTELY